MLYKGETNMQNIYKMKTSPEASQENILKGERYRITMLTDGLVRLEYSEDGIFEDRATQMVINRDFPKTEYRVIRTGDGIEIHTDRIHLIYNEKEFSKNGLSIQVKGNFSAYHSIWRYSEPVTDLGGTARTLDEADGSIPLDHGVVSRNGFSLLDDSRSQVLLDDGWIEPRKKGIQDLYFWGYGHDYKTAVADFYRLCGKTPMLPRYALGNWWSRYYKYTEKSYLELMDRFEKEKLPFTVAVIDMDWHVVDVDPKYGSGWTGYTWNRDFFPDPARFLGELHRRGMKTTLNVHPADGVQAHEEMYRDIAEAMGVDYEHEDPVICDPANPDFLEAYFKYLHHPREEEGVDFWWIDWQQGSLCKVEGLDPLWIFNHYHFLDSGRDGRRPITFSRYAGPGSHRYPVGFSGDTVITWDSLDFQPYFTVNASNVGYGWWSHDIGGHMQGYKNDEMTARWVQFGVYSPINRLHSSSSEFNGKEPWRYNKETELVMGEMLRERHRMIPYLYTMNHRNYSENVPLMMPMYYEWPEAPEAYEVKNQYYFGSGMVVAPITSERIRSLNVAKVRVWLPEGRWHDIYTGMMYDGGRMTDMYRGIESIPVLAAAGSIIPYTDEISPEAAQNNPASLRIEVYSGKDGEFELYEDDNVTCGYENGDSTTTKLSYREGADARFTIYPAEGNVDLIPEKRAYTVEFNGVSDCPVCAAADGDALEIQSCFDEERGKITVTLPEVSVRSRIEVTLKGFELKKENHIQKRCFDFLNQAEIDFMLKDRIYALICREKRIPVLESELLAMNLDRDLFGALTEIITALNDK